MYPKYNRLNVSTWIISSTPGQLKLASDAVNELSGFGACPISGVTTYVGTSGHWSPVAATLQ